LEEKNKNDALVINLTIILQNITNNYNNMTIFKQEGGLKILIMVIKQYKDREDNVIISNICRIIRNFVFYVDKNRIIVNEEGIVKILTDIKLSFLKNDYLSHLINMISLNKK
jgi:hypothetical protein